MLSRELNPGLGRAGRVKPQLEGLEDRCCPAPVTLLNHVLTLTGYPTASVIRVADNGQGKISGSVSDALHHTQNFSDTGVDEVVIDSPSGHDEIFYSLTATLKQSEQLMLNLGLGSDTVNLDFSKGAQGAAVKGAHPALGVTVNGVNSNVTARFNTGPLPAGYPVRYQNHLLTLATDPTSGGRIAVADNGQGGISVTAAEATYSHTLSVNGVQSINIDSTTSDSQISYTLTNTLKQSEQLNLNLGQGNDQVRLDLSKGISSPKAGVIPKVGITVDGGGGDNEVSAVFGAINNANLNLTAKLGNGWDHFQANFSGALTGQTNVNVNVNGGSGVSGVNVAASGAIAANASLSVKVADGSNDDTSSVSYAGKLLGHLSIQESAGAGWDWLESNINLAPGSTGWLMAHEMGGAGADLLMLMVRNDGLLHRLANHTLDESISGVNSSSAVVHTTNVKVS